MENTDFNIKVNELTKLGVKHKIEEKEFNKCVVTDVNSYYYNKNGKYLYTVINESKWLITEKQKN